ncbi:peroxiredoxin [Ascidiimonas sp. W6]|uniref:peroxiredoxin n=1 Tax=Ascidiimonas meishanensis TaxID=3128903 RepID=UPI0030EB23D5
MSLKAGSTLPEFSLKDQNGDSFLSKDLIGHKKVVIFFYPKDFTPGCTKEVCSFRDSYEEFQKLGAEVIGISGDSEKSHQKFSDYYKLPFRLLSDKGNKVRKLFGVPKSLLGILPGRETYVFNKEGKAIMVFNNMSGSIHMKKALAILKNE